MKPSLSRFHVLSFALISISVVSSVAACQQSGAQPASTLAKQALKQWGKNLDSSIRTIAPYAGVTSLGINLSKFFPQNAVPDQKNPIQTPVKSGSLPPVPSSLAQQDGDTYFSLAYAAVKRGDDKTALALLTQAIDSNAKCPYYSRAALRVSRAAIYNKFGFPEKALRDALQAIEINAKNADAYETAGDSYNLLYKWTEAIQAYNQALALDDSRRYIDQVFSNRGGARMHLQQYELAEKDFRTAISRSSVPSEIYLTDHASSLGLLGRYDEALPELDKALRIKPDYIPAFQLQAAIYFELKRYPEAIAVCTAGLKRRSDYELYWSRATCFNELDELQKATADLDQAIALKPQDADSYILRGDLHRRLGELQKAIADLDQAIVLKPQYAEGYVLRGDVYRRLGMDDLAKRDNAQAAILQSKP